LQGIISKNSQAILTGSPLFSSLLLNQQLFAPAAAENLYPVTSSSSSSSASSLSSSTSSLSQGGKRKYGLRTSIDDRTGDDETVKPKSRRKSGNKRNPCGKRPEEKSLGSQAATVLTLQQLQQFLLQGNTVKISDGVNGSGNSVSFGKLFLLFNFMLVFIFNGKIYIACFFYFVLKLHLNGFSLALCCK